MLIEFVNIVKKLSNNCLNLYDQDHFMHLNLFRILQTDAFKKKRNPLQNLFTNLFIKKSYRQKFPIEDMSFFYTRIRFNLDQQFVLEKR